MKNKPAVILILALALTAAASALLANGDAIKNVLDNLPWRNIGPANMGGRVDDVAVVESDPRTVYLATASGGLWKTVNNGITWQPLFDDQPVSSIGDVAVAPSDPSIVWVGTGEPNNRQSSSWGNGVYKSSDAGHSWQHMGLKETHHIGRIVIHPTDPDTVYVAAVGHLWGSNPERGLYKSSDGGKSWTRSLFIDEDTGMIDVAMDPQSPGTLYAAAYQRRRTVFGFNGGGSGSGLYKSTDGGENWARLGKAEGWPSGDTGRIGVDVYRKDPRIVYAIIQHREGGVFRSEDRGASWTRMSDTNPRPMYYSKIRIDPNNDQRIWVLGARMYYSEDGGKNFVTDWVQRIHGDHHAMWINPANSDHMVVGSDGGIHFSYDRGRSWDFTNTIPLGQFYEVGYDLQTPYNIYGGLQDNGSWGGPVRTLYRRGITNEDWFRIGGGDGFYVRVDPSNPDILYRESQNGNVSRLHLDIMESKSIRPQAPQEERYRFDWNSPILISPHDPETIFFGGNRLFSSGNRGDSWERSEDLSKNQNRDEMEIMGVVPQRNKTHSPHDGISSFGQIITISESPLKAGLLYVGTDDGNLQVSRDGGKSWKNVAANIPGRRGDPYVSRVVASRFAEGRVYATLDGHRMDDFSVYVYVSEDYGETWTPLTTGIAPGHTVNVIREHHRQQKLLFLGTEMGAYVSFDRGAGWHRLEGDFPTVPVDDIAIHPRDNDLIMGTHGRSIWVLDDITPLEQLSQQVLDADLHLFPPRRAVSYRIHNHKGSTGHKMFVAPNPPAGAMISYYLRTEPEEEEEVTVTILDSQGETVRTIEEAPKKAGLNRASWNMAHQSIPMGQGRRRFSPQGPRALPGTYQVRVEAGSHQSTQSFELRDDPRIRISAADRLAHFEAMMGLYRQLRIVAERQQATQKLSEQLKAAGEAAKGLVELPEEVGSEMESLGKKLQELNANLFGRPGRRFFGGGPTPLSFQLFRLYGSLTSFTEAPSKEKKGQIKELSGQVDEALKKLDQLIKEDVPKLNQALRSHNAVLQIQLDGE